jgi:hypothetical protein
LRIIFGFSGSSRRGLCRDLRSPPTASKGNFLHPFRRTCAYTTCYVRSPVRVNDSDDTCTMYLLSVYNDTGLLTVSSEDGEFFFLLILTKEKIH